MADVEKSTAVVGAPASSELPVQVLVPAREPMLESMPYPDPPSPQNAPPTEAQNDWLLAHPRHSRMSHGLSLAGWVERGTLRTDGNFVPESLMPVHDGQGDFGVGVALGRRW